MAGGRAGYGNSNNGLGPYGNPIVPKPVTADMEGVALVGGYSQAMLKVFLDDGVFEDKEEDEECKTAVKHKLSEEDDDLVEVEVDVERAAKRQKIGPLGTMKKAISHKAYDMLEVVD